MVTKLIYFNKITRLNSSNKVYSFKSLTRFNTIDISNRFDMLNRFILVLTLRQWPWAMLQFSTSVEVRVGIVR